MPPNSPQNRLDANLHMADGDDVAKNLHAYDTVKGRIKRYEDRLKALEDQGVQRAKTDPIRTKANQPLKETRTTLERDDNDFQFKDTRVSQSPTYYYEDGRISYWNGRGWSPLAVDQKTAQELLKNAKKIPAPSRFGREYESAANWADVERKSADVDAARLNGGRPDGRLNVALKMRLFWKVAELEQHYGEVEQLIAALETEAKIDLKDPARLSNQLKQVATDGLKKKMNLSEKAADSEKLQTIHVDRYNEPFTNMDQRVYHLLRVPAHADVSFVKWDTNAGKEISPASFDGKTMPASGGYTYFELTSQFTRTVDIVNTRLKVIMDGQTRYATITRDPRLNNLIFTFDKVDEVEEKKKREDEEKKQRKEKEERDKREYEKNLKVENDKKEEMKKEEEKKDRERFGELQKKLPDLLKDFEQSKKTDNPVIVIPKIKDTLEHVNDMLWDRYDKLLLGEDRKKIESIKENLMKEDSAWKDRDRLQREARAKIEQVQEPPQIKTFNEALLEEWKDVKAKNDAVYDIFQQDLTHILGKVKLARQEKEQLQQAVDAANLDPERVPQNILEFAKQRIASLHTKILLEDMKEIETAFKRNADTDDEGYLSAIDPKFENATVVELQLQKAQKELADVAELCRLYPDNTAFADRKELLETRRIPSLQKKWESLQPEAKAKEIEDFRKLIKTTDELISNAKEQRASSKDIDNAVTYILLEVDKLNNKPFLSKEFPDRVGLLNAVIQELNAKLKMLLQQEEDARNLPIITDHVLEQLRSPGASSEQLEAAHATVLAELRILEESPDPEAMSERAATLHAHIEEIEKERKDIAQLKELSGKTDEAVQAALADDWTKEGVQNALDLIQNERSLYAEKTGHPLLHEVYKTLLQVREQAFATQEPVLKGRQRLERLKEVPQEKVADGQQASARPRGTGPAEEMPKEPGTMEQKPVSPPEKEDEEHFETRIQEAVKKLCGLLSERLGKIDPDTQFKLSDENPNVILVQQKNMQEEPIRFECFGDMRGKKLSVNGNIAVDIGKELSSENIDALFSYIARNLELFTQKKDGVETKAEKRISNVLGLDGLTLENSKIFRLRISKQAFNADNLLAKGVQSAADEYVLSIRADRVEIGGSVKFFQGDTLIGALQPDTQGFIVMVHDGSSDIDLGSLVQFAKEGVSPSPSAPPERLLTKTQKAERRQEEENAQYDKETNELKEKAAKSLVDEPTPKLLIAEYIKLLERAESITDGIITDTVENRKALTSGLQNLFVFLARKNPQVRSTAFTLAFSKDGRERELGGKILTSLAIDDQLVQRNLREILRTGRLPHFEAENSSNPSVAPSMAGTALDTLAAQFGDRTLAADIRNVLGAIYLRAVQLRTQESASSLKEGLYEYADIEESSLTDDDRRNVEILKKTLFINWTWKNTYEQEGKKTEIAKLIVRILKKGPQEARGILRKMADVDTEDTRKNALHLLLDGLVKKREIGGEKFEPVDVETQTLLAEIVKDKKSGVDLRRSALVMLEKTSYFSGGNELCKNIILSFLQGQDSGDRSLAIYALNETNRLSKEFFYVIYGDEHGIPKANQNFDAPEHITNTLLSLVDKPDLSRSERTSILRILRQGQYQLNSRIEWYRADKYGRALALNALTNALFLKVFTDRSSNTDDIILAVSGILTNGSHYSITPRIQLLKTVASLDMERKGIVLTALRERGSFHTPEVTNLLKNRLQNPGANPKQDAEIGEWLSLTQDFLKSVFDAKPPVSFDILESAVIVWRDIIWILEEQIGIQSTVPPITLTISDTYLDRIADEKQRSSMRTYIKKLQDNGLTSR